MKLALVILIHLIVLITNGSSESNPCPDAFQFKSNKHGIITIPPFEKGLNRLIVKIGIRDPYEGNNSIRLVTSVDDIEANVNRGQNILFKLAFMRGRELPNIVQIRLNSRDICIGPKLINTQEFELRTKYFFKPSYKDSIFENSLPSNSFKLPPYPSQQKTSPLESSSWKRSRRSPQSNDAAWLGSLPDAGSCGRSLVPTHLIINGVGVLEGEYPWMVAMFHYKGDTAVYRCGATLISKTYVITAAHCTKNQARVRLDFGRYNITERVEAHSFHRVSTNIIPHPEYDGQAQGDIALVSFEPISFTEWVKPICLWANFDTKLRRGAVAGWGQLDNDGSESKTPKQLIVPMVALEMCRNSKVQFQSIATDKTFCAGGQNAGPCHGDSGGGFYIIHENIWYLRGIISRSLGTSWTCNVNEYAVYADLAYSLDWMRRYLSSPVPDIITVKPPPTSVPTATTKMVHRIGDNDYIIDKNGVFRLATSTSSTPKTSTTTKKLSDSDYDLSKNDYIIDKDGVIRLVPKTSLSVSITPKTSASTKNVSYSDYAANPSKYDYKINANGVVTFVPKAD